VFLVTSAFTLYTFTAGKLSLSPPSLRLFHSPTQMHLSPATRRAVVDLVEEGHVPRVDVARALHCSPSTVTNTIERFHRTGELHDAPRTGPLREYGDEEMERLRHVIREGANLTAAGLIRAMGPSAPRVSERTIRRYRRQLDFTPRKGRITAKQSGTHNEARKAWAWEQRRAQVMQWVHTDESTLCMRDTGDIVWHPRGEPSTPLEVEKLRCHVNIWGMVWDEGSVFAQFEGHFNTDAFIEVLDEHLLPHKENLAGRTFLLDRHPVHRTKRLRAWFELHGFKIVMLPTHSPQFNGIEGCWSWIKHYVQQMGPTSEVGMRADVDAAGDAITLEVIEAHLSHAQKTIRDYAYNT
jgi:transposase